MKLISIYQIYINLDLFLKNQKAERQKNKNANKKTRDGIINWENNSWQIYNLTKPVQTMAKHLHF